MDWGCGEYLMRAGFARPQSQTGEHQEQLAFSLQTPPPASYRSPRPVTCRDPAALREQKYHDVTVCMVQGGVSFMVKSYQDQDVYRELQQAMASDGCGVVRVIRPEEEG